MNQTRAGMEASELFEMCETALAVCELPEFPSADDPGQFEVLKYLGDDDTWALAPARGPLEDYVAVDAAMAEELLTAHIRTWLLLRGFQVQVHCYATRRRWSLVDCLSAADGGGDRLDVDYPCGPEELRVLVDSVLAVNTI